MLTAVRGKVRGLFNDIHPTGDEKIGFPLSGQGEQLVAQAAAPYQEIVRQGRAFSVRTTTAVDSVLDLSTPTVHTLAIYNNAPDGGQAGSRCLIIDRVWAMFTVQGAATQHHVGMIGLLGQTRVAAPTLAQEGALVIRKLNGMGETTPGRVDSSVLTLLTATGLDAVTGVAIGWFPLGDSVNTAAVSTPGFQMQYLVNGKIIVPPGRFFAIHTLASSVTSSCSAQMGIEWNEKLLLLG